MIFRRRDERNCSEHIIYIVCEKQLAGDLLVCHAGIAFRKPDVIIPSHLLQNLVNGRVVEGKITVLPTGVVGNVNPLF